MSRRKSPLNQTAPTLFPFLAVLICTMGAIIVLLVLVVKRADIQANQSENKAALKVIAEKKQRLSDQLEVAKNNIGLLQGLRPQLKERLDAEKSMLGHLTSHVAQLREDFAKLKSELETMAAPDSSEDNETELQNQIYTLSSQIADEKKKLAEKKSLVKDQKQTFAIIPHATGGNGTFRRPIFVECDSQGVTLQPYGVTLQASDFPNPMAAGNPLDAALVMIRDYWNQVDPSQKEGQPYPLFVVRPSGSKSFAAARKAMKSWVDEFGYELVTAEVDITYPKPDSEFQSRLSSAIEIAKQRQQATIVAINRNQALQQIRQLDSRSGSSGGSGSGGGYRASSITGGFVKEPGRTGSRSNFASSQRPASNNFSSTENSNSSLTSNDKRNSDSPANPPNRNSGFNASLGSTASPSPNEAGSQLQRGGSSLGDRTNGSGASSSSFQNNGSLNNRNGSNRSEANSTSSNSESGNSNASKNSGGPGGNSTAGNGQQLPAESIARSRGSNWALPSKANNSIQVRKPIKVLVGESDIQIIELGKGIKSIPFEKNTASAVPELVEQVWKHIDAWGIAGVNSYWKPELNAYVSPNASSRLNDLEVLLSGSGLDIRRVR